MCRIRSSERQQQQRCICLCLCLQLSYVCFKVCSLLYMASFVRRCELQLWVQAQGRCLRQLAFHQPSPPPR
jgi:hypothetical protein